MSNINDNYFLTKLKGRISRKMRNALLFCIGLSAIVFLCIIFPTNAADDGPKVTDKVKELSKIIIVIIVLFLITFKL